MYGPRALTFHIQSEGTISYERERNFTYPWHMMEKTSSTSNDGDITNLADGTINLLV
jgi:hypothetical protein